MEFADQLKQFSKRIASMKDSIQTEEATKTSLIMPFFSLLGYDVFNPSEFTPEFTADVGIKKGEKVDYAILNDGKPVILIEAKWIGESLDKHDSQLFRYFGTTSAKFAILTNGEIYRFYTDLDEPNKMDATPFLEVDMTNIKPSQIPELMKFHKSQFAVDGITSTASALKYTGEFQSLFSKELQAPSDEFLKFFLSSTYSGRQTQAVMERFRPVLKKALNDYISELMNEKIKSALNVDANIENAAKEDVEESSPEEKAAESKIITTTEELGAFFIIRTILRGVVPVNDVAYKDTTRYFGILYQNKTTKWICRLILNDSQKSLIIPDANKEETKYPLDSIYDIENYREQLIESAKRYIL